MRTQLWSRINARVTNADCTTALGAAVLVTLFIALTLATAVSRARSMGTHELAEPQAASEPSTSATTRNLVLQPQAAKLARRVGKRFIGSRRQISVMNGTLTMNGGQQAVTITRRQGERDERVEVSFADATLPVTWSDDEGSTSRGEVPTEIQKTLIERLAFDSVDHFILAQQRGAAYFTVAWQPDSED